MDSDYELYIKRARNEINLSKMIMIISEDDKIQADVFEMPADTYYSAVISHAYYSIFYMAKAYLLTKNIVTEAPEEHRKTYEAFKKMVEQGAVDVELLKIYQQLMMRADTLLKIFQKEKGKRGNFTYRTLPQANAEPAKESLANAETFFKHVNSLCR
ncbi:MAG: HEPN domain-containing protein [Nanoarchaeota archaeon]|nr:HEPN domain-containing protein [Nanoarchaeota archaeon]